MRFPEAVAACQEQLDSGPTDVGVGWRVTEMGIAPMEFETVARELIQSADSKAEGVVMALYAGIVIGRHMVR